MDRTSSTSFSQNAVQALEHDSPLGMLPDDVLPNIFSRLPASDLFTLASVSKQVQHLIHALLPDATGREFRALSLHNPGDFVQRLAALLRLGSHYISNEDWTNFLQAVKGSNIDRKLVVDLMLSLAPRDAVIRDHPDTLAISGHHSYQTNNPEFAALICAAGMKHLMREERLGGAENAQPIQLSNRPGWKRLVGLFRIFSPADQMNVLLQIKPRELDGENMGLAFDELVDMHLANLVKLGGFSYTNPWLWQEPPAKRDAYFDILSSAYSMAPSPDRVTYFQDSNMCLGTPPFGLGKGPWRQHTPAHCRFVFRLLAYETRTNLAQNLKTFSNAIRNEVEFDFLTEAEFSYFTKKLNVRVDQGMLLEDAVSKWIDENRGADSCVIS